MTCAEFGLWTQYRMLSYKSSTLFTDGRKTAERFSEENYRHIYRLRKSLVDKGWLEETKEKKRGKNGMWSATHFKVLNHEQWVKKHGSKQCKTNVFEEPEPVTPVSMDSISPVTPVSMACDTRVNGPVTPVSHSSKKNQFEIKTSLKLPLNPGTPFKNTKTDAQNSREGTSVPPVTPVSMVYPVPGAFYEPQVDRLRPWSAPRRQCTAEEVAEIRRRNDMHLKPEDVLVLG
jgi:hypothetical protein